MRLQFLKKVSIPYRWLKINALALASRFLDEMSHRYMAEVGRTSGCQVASGEAVPIPAALVRKKRWIQRAHLSLCRNLDAVRMLVSRQPKGTHSSLDEITSPLTTARPWRACEVMPELLPIRKGWIGTGMAGLICNDLLDGDQVACHRRLCREQKCVVGERLFPPLLLSMCLMKKIQHVRRAIFIMKNVASQKGQPVSSQCLL